MLDGVKMVISHFDYPSRTNIANFFLIFWAVTKCFLNLQYNFTYKIIANQFLTWAKLRVNLECVLDKCLWFNILFRTKKSLLIQKKGLIGIQK